MKRRKELNPSGVGCGISPLDPSYEWQQIWILSNSCQSCTCWMGELPLHVFYSVATRAPSRTPAGIKAGLAPSGRGYTTLASAEQTRGLLLLLGFQVRPCTAAYSRTPHLLSTGTPSTMYIWNMHCHGPCRLSKTLRKELYFAGFFHTRREDRHL
jgi:hypothetical protein